MHFLRCLRLLAVALASSASAQSTDDDDAGSRAPTNQPPPEYLIVGAGGSGLQTALLLLKHNSSFQILEKSSRDVGAGSFWTQYPRFDELISVNKAVRNETQRYRYDWHSFLECPYAGMRDVSEEYFPSGTDWHRYMNLVADRSGIVDRIEFDTTVERLATDGTPCVHLATGEKRCALRRVFVGTGLVEHTDPVLDAMGGIPYSKASKERAKARRVCIIGNGNSGHELAQNVIGVADRVTLYGRSPTRLSSVTRYTGDVRVKYLQITENIHAKLLDTADTFIKPPKIKGLSVPMTQKQVEYVQELARTGAWLDQFECEAFFYATGFASVVPGLDFKNSPIGETWDGSGDECVEERWKKDAAKVVPSGEESTPRFPPTGDWYAWNSNPSVHFIGWLMHERDFRRGAGGFLSGYRYLIRNLVNHVLTEDQSEPQHYPRSILSLDEAARRAVVRCQTADDLIVLQDGVVLRDAIVPIRDVDVAGSPGGLTTKDVGKFFYYEGISYEFHPDIASRDDVVYLYFGWGNGRTAGHVFEVNMRYSDTGTLINMFLHPVVEVGTDGTRLREIHEDLEMAWKDDAYIQVIDSTVRNALTGNLASFGKRSADYSYQRITFNQTEAPGYYEAAPLKAKVNAKWLRAMSRAVYTGQEKELHAMKDIMKGWMPSLYEHEEGPKPEL